MSNVFSKFATSIAGMSGKPGAYVLAVTLVLVWAISGPFFGYSETWQLVINTSTTIITFLMVFVLQNSQNRDGKALQAKLDELILTSQAQNKFVGIEKLDEEFLARDEQDTRRKSGVRRGRRGRKDKARPSIGLTLSWAASPPRAAHMALKAERSRV